MKIAVACILLGTCCCLHAQDLGLSGPPYVESTVTIPTKLLNDGEKRCDMVSDLAEKSEMNYRLLAMKIMEKWQDSMKKDKNFLKDLKQCKKVAFTVHEDGSIEIKGVEDPAGKKRSSKGSSAKSKNKQDTADSSP